MKTIQDYMTQEQIQAYAFAASLSAANEQDRAAWAAAVNAEKMAKQKAIESFTGEIKLNRNGQYFGVCHPALLNIGGFLNINNCYAPD